jgi:hypothetical protein
LFRVGRWYRLEVGGTGMMGMDNQADCVYFTLESEATCDESTMGCIWRPFLNLITRMVDEGAPICAESSSSVPTLSLIQSGYSMLDTEAPTSAPTRSPVVNSTRLTSISQNIKTHLIYSYICIFFR